MSTIPQLRDLKQRLNQLSLQKARYGISADPHILNEASDLETVISQMELIDINRRNLDHLIRQRDSFGGQPPIHIVNQIVSARSEVARLRQVCARLDHSVPSHPLDSDEPAELPPVQTTSARVPSSDILLKLQQIEQLVQEIRAAL